jgi:glyoxylate reductase
MSKHPALFITHRGQRHQTAALEAAPAELDITLRRSPSRQEIIDLLPGMEFLISERSLEIDAGIIAAGKNLRLIQRLGSQTYDIDLEAARKAGIPVCFWPVLTCVSVAEHMLLQILALAKNLRDLVSVATDADDWGIAPRQCDEDWFAYNWSGRKEIRTLFRSTVGIVGYGEIGAELAARLKNFGCTVLYNKRTRIPEFAEKELNIHFAEMDDLLQQSDFVCILLPYSPEIDHMINQQFVAKMKKGACLVTCGSGGIIVESALAEAVTSGHLFGVAADTYDWEPIRADNPLLPLARRKGVNVLLTPHTAAGPVAAFRDERVQDYTNLLRVLQGKELLNRLV